MTENPGKTHASLYQAICPGYQLEAHSKPLAMMGV
jgi:hypothetical protein